MEFFARTMDLSRALRQAGAAVIVASLVVGFSGPVGSAEPANGYSGHSRPSRAVLPPSTAHAVIERVIAQNPSLKSYQARVHLDVHMLNFPFLAPKLDGTSYFKRPNNYEVVFDRVPGYAKGFSTIFTTVGDPSSWEQDSYVTFDGHGQFNGRDMLVLRMIKKIHSDILAYTLAFIDPSTYTVQGMEWHYTNGGVISMAQNFRNEGPFMVIGSQHITVDIPHVHAVGDASYGIYQTNVALDEAVFTR